MNYGESDGRALLDRMTAAEDSGQQNLTPDQITAMVEIFVPRMITECPGFKGAGMKCKVERDDAGWSIRIDR